MAWKWPPAIPGHVRPSFKEVEGACRNKAGGEAAPEAAAAPRPNKTSSFLSVLWDKTRPIIIVKKKGGHGGHHGGAWKVAYADFVTAMMSLFIVLWLLSFQQESAASRGWLF